MGGPTGVKARGLEAFHLSIRVQAGRPGTMPTYASGTRASLASYVSLVTR